MRTSIIIPMLNEAPRIASAIERAWALRPHEVIAVDGGSGDQTVAAGRSAGATVVEGPRGRSLQQNLGAARATGDVLLFLHADTWLARGSLAQVVEALKDASVPGGAFCQHIEAEGRLYRLLERGNAWRVRRLGLAYGDQAIFLRRTVFDALGGFPEVDFMEDLLLMQRVRRRGRPVLLPGPLYVSARRWQRDGLVRQTARNWLLLSAARVGIPPNRLARFYPPHEEVS